jgi:nanoRNase/pAp phosphatase (c-di-AMP/oligoRNAs hydrolase)
MKAPVPNSSSATVDDHPRARARGVRTHRMVLRGRTGPVQKDKLDKLVAFARGHRRALILTHDNPDPDSLASGVALAWLLEKLAGVDASVAYGGIIGRAENRALIRVLKLPVVPVSRVVFDDYDLICMVDTQPEQGNHSLPRRHFPDVVIDHHPMRPDSHLVPIADVGGPIGATSTVVVEYVRASGLDIPPEIATALFYGIKADTRDLGRQTTGQDVDAYLWLFPRVDKDAMGAIEHPALPVEYFALTHTAVERAQLHDNAVVIPLGPLYAPDMVAEVAERFLSLEGMRWSLAYGEYDGDTYFSVRTADGRANAGRLIRELIEPRGGSAGGHGAMAGARLGGKGLTAEAMRRLIGGVVRDFLHAIGDRGRPSRRIVGGRPRPAPARSSRA